MLSCATNCHGEKSGLLVPTTAMTALSTLLSLYRPEDTMQFFDVTGNSSLGTVITASDLFALNLNFDLGLQQSNSDAALLNKYYGNNNVFATMPNHIPVIKDDDDGSYQPSEYDVVCGRGKGSYNRLGNKRFRAIVKSHVQDYNRLTSKLDKGLLLSEIIDEIKAQDYGRASFVKKHKGKWYRINDEQAREKVGHAMREIAAQMKKDGKHDDDDDHSLSDPDGEDEVAEPDFAPSPPTARGNEEETHSAGVFGI